MKNPLLSYCNLQSYFCNQVAEVGVEPTESSGSRPDRFASLRTRPNRKDEGGRTKDEKAKTGMDSSFILLPSSFKLRVQESHLAAGVMSPCRALAHPQAE